MAEERETAKDESARGLDNANTSSMEIQALNNMVVSLRAVMRRVQLFTIQKLVRQSKQLRKSKADVENEKKQKKAERLVQDIGAIKGVKLDHAIKYSLGNTKTFEEVAAKGDLDTRAKVRLSMHPLMKEKVQKWRDEHEDWKALAAFILYKNTGRRYKKKKMKDTDYASEQNQGTQEKKSKSSDTQKSKKDDTEVEETDNADKKKKRPKLVVPKIGCGESALELARRAKTAHNRLNWTEEDLENIAQNETKEVNEEYKEDKLDQGENEVTKEDEAEVESGQNEEEKQSKVEKEESEESSDEEETDDTDEEANKKTVQLVKEDVQADKKTVQADKKTVQADKKTVQADKKLVKADKKLVKADDSDEESDDSESSEEEGSESEQKNGESEEEDESESDDDSGSDSGDETDKQTKANAAKQKKESSNSTPKAKPVKPILKAKPVPLGHKAGKEMAIKRINLNSVSKDMEDIPVESNISVYASTNPDGVQKPKPKKRDAFFDMGDDSDDDDNDNEIQKRDKEPEHYDYEDNNFESRGRDRHKKTESAFIGRLSDKQAKGDWGLNKRNQYSRESSDRSDFRGRGRGGSRGRGGFERGGRGGSNRDEQGGHQRGGGSERDSQGHGNQPGTDKGTTEEKPIHPSWEAKRKRKELESRIVVAQGKKTKFDD